ncbi:MAG: hypothetical protein IJQ77_09085 [Synergistaceae bacterium]|nr:hypothetical protein [Synergistaceae bacterium]
MSRPFFSVRYAATRNALPPKLERGRAYFIGDEQIILVDYGNGPIAYGNKPGPQGIAGEPIPQLQGQIDDLASASIETTFHLHEVFEKMLADRKNAESQFKQTNYRIDEENSQRQIQIEAANSRIDEANENIIMTSEDLQKIIRSVHDDVMKHVESNSDALLELISYMHAQFTKIKNVIPIVTKLIASLYPNSDDDMYPEESEPAMKPLTKNEILSCETGQYRVRNSYTDSDGAVIVILDLISESDQARILTLKDGDKIITGSNEIWTVSNYNLVNEQGVLTLSYAGTQYVLDTLSEGDVVEYADGKFTVNSIHQEDGQAVISLTLTEGI